MNYEDYIKKCIKFAKQGEGHVAPNPLVGAVVLDKNGDIAGYGYHQKYGEAHAEVNAINMAGEKTDGGTIFISLEPCSHYGKTPPCADLIIKSNIKKMVVGMIDPNPKVSGDGIKKCKDARIEVIVGVLEKECQKLNEIFIKNQKEQKPFIAIKTAITIDGKIATKTGSSKWITSEKSRKEVQKLRNKYDAILTGSGTVLADNPSLTCQMNNGINPARIVIDSKFKTLLTSKVYNNDGTKIFIAVDENIKIKNDISKNINLIKCPLINDKIDLNYLIEKLYNEGITSILVEAGGTLNAQFIKQKLVDKFYIFTAPKILGDNNGKSFIDSFNIADIKECTNLIFDEIIFLKPDILIKAYLT
ncbi:MAG: bifunctional diaminohydroxyphosphoribosylaminopyrimidine deaminase/5-amino-6-(5-phosphoribosylamino)uracil reductase RibD [Candidatus Gastranaerophilales bacterium]|nr:bifunctional diaminohydroxyphosphoribosylaminopyrimidine deaminase/5-amino-6-(5-phosphoribosylamino)uracil reductase RibD [Candidatus Gastranaerophilales bacterium]